MQTTISKEHLHTQGTPTIGRYANGRHKTSRHAFSEVFLLLRIRPEPPPLLPGPGALWQRLIIGSDQMLLSHTWCRREEINFL